MIYAEYIARDRALPLEVFRHLGKQDWVSDVDVMVANLGRTMKMGPEPHCMCWWRIGSMARMDEWEAHFRTDAGRLYASTSPVARALDFTRAGLYDELVGGGRVLPRDGLFVVEFFAADEASPQDVGEWFAGRAGGELLHVMTRIGLMAPDPGGMALWRFGSYVEAEPFLRSLPPAGPVRVTAAGLYRNFGDDIP